MASPGMAGYLQIQWEEADFTHRRDGYADSQISVSGLVRRGPKQRYGEYEVKPLVMLYVYDADMEKKKARRLLEKMFKSDELAVASRVIRFVSCATKDLPDSLVPEYGMAEPAFVFLDGKANELERVDQVVQAVNLVRKLNKLYRTQYDGTISNLLRDTMAVLEDIDDVNKELPFLRDRVARTKSDYDKKHTNGNKKNWEEAEAELAAVLADLDELMAEREALSKPVLSKDKLKELKATAPL